MKLSLVLVAYGSAQYLPAAIDSFRREAREQGYEHEVVVVDHSEDPEEHARLAASQPDALLARPNRGYAAGINSGVAEARGDLLLVGNPDIEFQPGSLQPLVTALDGPWDVVGPQFLLGDFLLPPADIQTPWAELSRIRAARSVGYGRRKLVREAQSWIAVWEAERPVPTKALSGALIGYSAATARRVGPWDEEYFLYFEETDWLRRAQRARLRVAQVPVSQVIHAWGHAAEPLGFQPQFARSRLRYYRRHFSVLGGWIGQLDTSKLKSRPTPALTREILAAVPDRCWWLLAFSPVGLPAAGARLNGSELPAAVHRFLTFQPACPTPYLIAFDPREGSVMGTWSWADGLAL